MAVGVPPVWRSRWEDGMLSNVLLGTGSAAKHVLATAADPVHSSTLLSDRHLLYTLNANKDLIQPPLQKTELSLEGLLYAKTLS